MTIKKNLLILIPMFFLLGIATFSLLEKDIESEVLNEGSGCSSCSGPKAFKAKISQTKIKKRSLQNHCCLHFHLST